MIQKQRRRSDEEWLELIKECRSSGLSDQAWCSDHGIPPSTFYNRISHLRKKAREIPPAEKTTMQPLQQVVPLTIMDDTMPQPCAARFPEQSSHTPAITLSLEGCRLEIHNHADRDTLANTLLALRHLC